MTLAIEEARKGIGYVAPNPPVGCVIVSSQGDLISKGHHRAFGGNHAEIEALAKVNPSESLRDCVMYVTLEPCAHEGKTPACAKKLATLSLKKVVYGLVDPNPQVAGRGLKILMDAGIEVEKLAGLQDDLEELAEIFLFNYRQKKTFVSLKVATSLDGHMAHVSGESRWITGEAAREHGHFLRAVHDAILVGKNTVVKDNPRLNIRHSRFPDKKNKVILLDGHGELADHIPRLNLFKDHDKDSVIFAVGEVGAKKLRSVDPDLNCWILPFDKKGGVDLDVLLQKAFDEKILSLLVEGGPTVVSSFLSGKKVQRYNQFIAPTIIGGGSGINATKGFAVSKLSDKIQLRAQKIFFFGPDVLITGRIE